MRHPRPKRSVSSKRLSFEPLETRCLLDGAVGQLGLVGGTVWEDLDRDGIQDVGERGVPMVEVRLLDDNAWTVQATTTDGNGQYQFSGLPLAEYQVEVAAAPGARFTLQDQGSTDSLDSDVDPDSGRTAPWRLTSGSAALRDAGFARLVWPAGWAAMEIEAKWTTTESVLEMIKADFGANGSEYEFAIADTTERYRVEIRWEGHPRKFTDYYYDNPWEDLSDALHALRHRTSEQWDGTGTAPDFDDDLSNLLDYTGWEEAWQKVQYKSTPTRLGAVWLRDEFGNAQLDSASVAKALSGRTLDVHEGDDPVAHVEADHPNIVWADDWPFLYPIDDRSLVVDYRYRVRFLDRDTGEERFELSLDKARQYQKNVYNQYTPYSDLFEVELEALNVDRDNPQKHSESQIDELFRLVTWFQSKYPMLKPSTASKSGHEVVDGEPHEYWQVHGSVWGDLDRDGVRNTTETGLPGATVRLLSTTLSTVATTATDSNGFYGFRDVSPGEYLLELDALPGTLFTGKDQGGDDALDSDVDPATGRTEPFLVAGEQTTDRDAGLYGSLPAARVAGLVWGDPDGDGIRDLEETGIGDVTVKLLDGDLAVISSTTTAADGGYSFDGLESGWYSLEFAAPEDSTLSPMNRGNDDLVDSDANRVTGRTAPFSVIAGQDDVGRDAGLYGGSSSADVQRWLRITEIKLDSPKFIELKNIGPESLDLTGVRLTGDVEFDFALSNLGSLFPGEHVVLVEDFAGFVQQHDTTEMNIAGPYEGTLDGQGERLQLVDPLNKVILDTSCQAGWFAITQYVGGFSLTVVDETADSTRWNDRTNWRPGSLRGGSPGADDPHLTPNPGAIVINEIMSNPADGFSDWVELHNTTAEDIDIGGWYLADDRNGAPRFTSYRIALGTIIPAGGYVVLVQANQFGNAADPGCNSAFGLGRRGERVQLTAADARGNLLGYSESVTYGEADVDVTFGPYGTDYVVLTYPTMGSTNTVPRDLQGVFGRHVFYNNSTFDDNESQLDELDNGAIAVDKTALLPGGTAEFENYTSYSRGINGIIVDIAGLPSGYTPAATDFEFKVGNNSDPSGWAYAPSPTTIAVQEDAPAAAADRITITWEDHAIQNQWLQVTVKAGAGMALTTADVFYFGNVVAEVGNSTADARVTVTDLLSARNNPSESILSPAPITSLYDFNRDKRVDATDVLLARNNQASFLNALELIDLAGVAAESQPPLPAELVWLTDLDQPASRRPAQKDAAADAVDMLLAAYPAE